MESMATLNPTAIENILRERSQSVPKLRTVKKQPKQIDVRETHYD